MKIRTSSFMDSDRECLWPLLTQSTMEVPGCFCFGLPRPVACELPERTGGVGAERRCISDRGVVVQRITAWEPLVRLRFKMVSTDHCWSSYVESIEEDFRLESWGKGTRITRTTSIRAMGPFRIIKELGFYLGLKRVHLYVFKNWRATSIQTAGRDRSDPSLRS